MLEEKYQKLDDIAAPNNYVAVPTEDDLNYILEFQKVCARYHIDFSLADEDEREFVMKMAEKRHCAKGA